MKHQSIIKTLSTLLIAIVVTLAFIGGGSSWPPTIHAQRGLRAPHTNNEVVVKLTPQANAKLFAQQHRLIAKQRIKANIYLFEMPANDSRSVQDVVDQVTRDRNTIWAEPHFLASIDQDEGDTDSDQRSGASVDQRNTPFVDGQSPPSYFGQNALSLIRAQHARQYASGAGVIVAVIDTGVDASHPAIGAIYPGWDFVNNDADPSEAGTGPAYGHGTHVASIIKLIAPGAVIMPQRAFKADGKGKTADIANAIYNAVDYGAQVINMSFSMTTNSSNIREAVAYAANHGVVLVSTAGNTGTSAVRYPAFYLGVIGVAATDEYDRRASFSSYGVHVRASAPGVGIYGAYPGNQWAWWSGTSFAAPMVSGQAALLISRGRSTNYIFTTAVPLPDSGMGSGRIDCLASVQ
ncbi:MAG: S8 family serine peptidase [Acidobacteriota bacterium]|nr:S8 family serine peptidase [Blastocatellia bacterium]MDW8238544.1 S8 family serine peptidase [Acidobacteriota bacterium]